MATHDAIYGISNSIRLLLIDKYPSAWGIPQVELVQPTAISGGVGDGKNGFTISLYRVSVSGTQRPQTPMRSERDGKLYPPSRLVDLHYLITPWASAVDRQHQMLGWLITLIEDMGALSSALLNRNLADPDTFGLTENVQLGMESLPLVEHFNLWDKLRNGFPPSATCVARMVALESTRPIEETAPVHTRKFIYSEVGAA